MGRKKHHIEKVALEPFRDRYEYLLTQGATRSSIAFAMGYTIDDRRLPYPRADISRLKRTLGLYETINGRGTRNRNRHIHYATAVKLGKAMGMDPHEWDV